MSPRSRRLQSDLRQMEEHAAAGNVMFRTEGNPPEIYHVMLTESGLALGSGGRVTLRKLHRCDIYLHADYPRRPPVVTWLTPIFHPNILGPDRNGGVCIGSWSASESLADLCTRLRDLVAYRSLNPIDALDKEAASWVQKVGVTAGADLSQLTGLRVDTPSWNPREDAA